MDAALTPDEKAEFESFLRSHIEGGTEIKRRSASAYLRAVKTVNE